MAPAAIKVKRFDDYVAKLEAAKVVLDPARRAGDHPRRRQEPRVRARLRAGRGRGPARRGRRPGRMAGGADGLVRRGVPENPARGDPHHHPQQPEVLRAARPQDRHARQQVHPGRQHRGERRRQGDRRRQRARDPRAAVGREVLLRDRSQDHAGRPAAEVRSTSCSTRSSARRRSASRASSGWRPSSRRWSAPMSTKAKRAAKLAKADLAHRGGRRVPRAAGPDGQILRAGAGRGRKRRRARSRSTTSRSVPATACRPIRCRSRSRSRTRSTFWSASGRSTRSRPEARTLTRYVVQRSGWFDSSSKIKFVWI